jgi:hypothetical protein
VGERPGHRAQWPRAHPCRRCRAMRSCHERTLTLACLTAAPARTISCSRCPGSRSTMCGWS